MVVPVVKKFNKAQTWPLVLGIIFVICLDVAFTAYMASDASAEIALNTVNTEDSFELAPVPEALLDSTTAAEEPEITTAAAETDDPSPAAPRTSYASERRRDADRSDSRPGKKAKNFVITTPPNWEPRVITYNASQPVTFQPRPEPAAVSNSYPSVSRYVPRPNAATVTEARVRRPEKNPFMMVIKKPWQLMKAIASKFR